MRKNLYLGKKLYKWHPIIYVFKIYVQREKKKLAPQVAINASHFFYVAPLCFLRFLFSIRLAKICWEREQTIEWKEKSVEKNWQIQVELNQPQDKSPTISHTTLAIRLNHDENHFVSHLPFIKGILYLCTIFRLIFMHTHSKVHRNNALTPHRLPLPHGSDCRSTSFFFWLPHKFKELSRNGKNAQANRSAGQTAGRWRMTKTQNKLCCNGWKAYVTQNEATHHLFFTSCGNNWVRFSHTHTRTNDNQNTTTVSFSHFHALLLLPLALNSHSKTAPVGI